LAALRFGPFPREPVAGATGSFQRIALLSLRWERCRPRRTRRFDRKKVIEPKPNKERDYPRGTT